jgi:hypothetical protein
MVTVIRASFSLPAAMLAAFTGRSHAQLAAVTPVATRIVELR